MNRTICINIFIGRLGNMLCNAHRLTDHTFQHKYRFFLCSSILDRLILPRISQMDILYKTARVCVLPLCFHIHGSSRRCKILIIGNFHPGYHNGLFPCFCTEIFFYCLCFSWPVCFIFHLDPVFFFLRIPYSWQQFFFCCNIAYFPLFKNRDLYHFCNRISIRIQ